MHAFVHPFLSERVEVSWTESVLNRKSSGQVVFWTGNVLDRKYSWLL